MLSLQGIMIFMEKEKTGKLYLIPTVIATGTIREVISPKVVEVISELDYYLVENIRTARRFLSELNKTLGQSILPKPIEAIEFVELSKDTPAVAVSKQLAVVAAGRSAGIVSEAGCPGVADPGAIAVKYAHRLGIKVIPLVGPSSILLALMASGFNGQSFTFHGYLPINNKERANTLKVLEKEAHKRNQTQIFMETPYRNQKMFQDILQHCHGNTLLCVAKNITGPDECITTKSIQQWKSEKIDLHKMPAIFLISH